ncbi:MAG: class I SAM-dependent methyltransferase [Microgenomates group bacterium]
MKAHSVSTIEDVINDNRLFESQLRKPTGKIGKLVGDFMDEFNKDKSYWTIESLNIEASDIILEVGFGTGHSIRHLSKLASAGTVNGIDFSETMLEVAAKKCDQEIQQGKVILTKGDVSDSGFKSGTFDKILVVNVMYFWNDVVGTLSELQRILKPGGRIALFVYHKDSPLQKNRGKGGVFKEFSGQYGINLLQNAGFIHTKFDEKSFEDGRMIGVRLIGEKASKESHG